MVPREASGRKTVSIVFESSSLNRYLVVPSSFERFESSAVVRVNKKFFFKISLIPAGMSVISSKDTASLA